MDSYFKAAVCDLDKLLDDFELNTEHECKPVFLKPSAYPFYSLGSQCLPADPPSAPPNLPDLSSLHYGSAPGCADNPGGSRPGADDAEAGARPLTAVDLLSSVDCRPATCSAPPCPDRALKPVCDLVNDASSATLVRANSHDAFGDLDAAERQMEEEEALLVDFSSPAVAERDRAERAAAGEDELLGSGSNTLSGEYSSSLSLLDVILPAALGRGGESAGDSPPQPDDDVTVSSPTLHETQSTPSAADAEETTALPLTDRQESPAEGEPELPPGGDTESSDGESGGLSCLPLAVSMCGALVKPPEDEPGEATPQREEADDVSESAEADSEPRQDAYHSAESEESAAPSSQQVAEGSVRPNHRQLPSPDSAAPPSEDPACPEPSPVDPPEFGFEYLPESDQAELLVTDEELDAFLQAYTEAEQGSAAVPYCSSSGDCGRPESLSPPSGVEQEELRSCGTREDLEGLASPESDRMMCVSAGQATSNLGAALQFQDSSRPEEAESCSGANHSPTSNTSQSQHSSSSSSSSGSSSPAQQHSYGGARPKQLHCQTPRSPPPAGNGHEEEEEEGEEEEGDETTREPSTPEDEECPSQSPEYPEEHSSVGACPAQDHREEDSGEYDELSEPPPYPGEPPADGSVSANWKRDGGEDVGSRQPAWVPDSEAPNCMNCTQRFTFTKRRHHCRACGKVYCAVCCNRKCKLKYLEKEARVCVVCFDSINRAQALDRMMSPVGPSPNPNVPSEYCSTIPPLQQARAAGTLNSPPPTVMVPVSVLKHPNHDGCPREQKRVWFADGILPNGEVADTTRLSVSSRRGSQEFSGVASDQTSPGPTGAEVSASSPSPPEVSGAAEVVRPPASGPWDYSLLSAIGSSVNRVPSLLPNSEDELPPLLITTGENGEGDVLVEDSPAPCQILHLLEEGGPRPLTFVLNANLLVNVKLVTYGGRHCWCFGSNGLQALGQKELVFLLECLPDEKSLPRDLFSLYLNIYQEAQKGKFLDELDNVTFTSTFLGSKDHAGVLFLSPTFQPLEGLTLPSQPFLFGLLIQKLEVPWAKVFPLRLLLRLGSEYNVYPTPLTSVRFRDSVFRETGHTIMNLLADLRNYQYSLSMVGGLRIHMEMGHSYIDIPKGSFNEMQKVVNSSNEHVISIGAHFSLEADSHLVCFQNEDGSYQTQANSMAGKTRTVTGASFVVFNGALKASSGFIAKSSIVEDGLMVQIPPETMESLRGALRDQRDFDIPCGRSDGGELRENVTVRWVDWNPPVGSSKASGVDGRPLDGVPSVRVLQDTRFESDGRAIRCTEVFYQLKTPDCSLASVLSSCNVFQKEMALSACGALTPHLCVLTASGINTLSLRISTQADMVEYQAGCGGQLLPQRYMNELDGALIPVIHGGSASVPQTAMDMEFIFYITHVI
ncbi:zinc finger FYVE domain-containing protein 16 isoform X2 [Nelusetta ayraudi]|uniref:zinc finger FYVE domain-containing protein 16 isoform X2 n=1 Tax=Nelusetta ayraudi TaxID=303726 RepID=UPI003F6F79E2